jgi:hypothetical protein
MVWNKDLAKLKQELKTDEQTEPKRPVPKPAVKPAVPRELDDEDALFLAAMGGRRQTVPSTPDAPRQAIQTPQPPPEDFTEAMASLKGMKPVAASKLPPRKEPASGPAALPPAPVEAPVPEALPAPEPEEALETARWSPQLIQLAAGMAIEVDGLLDLRGHSPADAVERLRERILDGHLLGWRTLHIHLGPGAELRQAFLDFLAGPEANLIARYAQAPIPMGGPQAWILYLGLQGPNLH